MEQASNRSTFQNMSPLIYSKIPAIIADLKPVGKDKTNKQQGWNFRGVDDMYDALMPLFAKHEVFVSPEVIDEKSEERKTAKGGILIYRILKVRFSFYASDGSNIVAVVVGEGMDSGDKASNKAMAVAFKYACFQVFCIATKEIIDPDSETHPESNKVENNKPEIYQHTPTQKVILEGILRNFNVNDFDKKVELVHLCKNQPMNKLERIVKENL